MTRQLSFALKQTLHERRRGATLALAAGLALLAGAGAGPSLAQDAPGGIVSVQISQEGRQVYEEICQACHMADAMGGDGAGAKIPALAGNARLADKAYPIAVVVQGRGGMPGFTDMLSDAQLAAVLTYVRGHFNPYPDPVSPADIAGVRTSPGSAADCSCVN